jgi:hypothetical protein
VGDGNSSGGERLLRGARELEHVAEGGDGEGAADAGGAQGGREPRRDAADVDAVGDVAVLEVPPHRHPYRPALVVLRRGSPPLAAAVATRDARRDEAAVDQSPVGVRGKAVEEDPGHGGGKGSAAVARLSTPAARFVVGF